MPRFIQTGINIPQRCSHIGVEILEEFGVHKGRLLDPYCGSGSSFASGLECGISQMYGFDINPLAVLISKVKFTKIDIEKFAEIKRNFRHQLFDFSKEEKNIETLKYPNITNIDFWFSKEVANHLLVLKHFIDQIKDKKMRQFFLLPFSETARECSYTRNNEFKLFRMKEQDLLDFNPDAIGIYFKKLEDVFSLYLNFYFPKLEKAPMINIHHASFETKNDFFDVVLTSPPYGDSRTTVAYGQFSTLFNEWLGIDYARQIDKMLMGGAKAKENVKNGLIADYIAQIEQTDPKRALEVSSFYNDLEDSIQKVAHSVKKGGKIFYVVGNRIVKNIQLPTDQFIAEKFEENGFKHLITYERALSGKSMPSKNSPTNKIGKTTNYYAF